MPHTLELPAGGSAEMKDSKEITRGEKKAAENARTRASAAAAESPLLMNGGEITPELLAKLKEADDASLQPFEDYQNLMVRTCLVSWTHGKLPAEGPDFDAMSDEDYEKLVGDAYLVIFRKPLEFGPDGVVDPKAPTDNSPDSAPTSPSTDDQSETTTPTPK